jgi:hypothetical protein
MELQPSKWCHNLCIDISVQMRPKSPLFSRCLISRIRSYPIILDRQPVARSPPIVESRLSRQPTVYFSNFKTVDYERFRWQAHSNDLNMIWNGIRFFFCMREDLLLLREQTEDLAGVQYNWVGYVYNTKLLTEYSRAVARYRHNRRNHWNQGVSARLLRDCVSTLDNKPVPSLHILRVAEIHENMLCVTHIMQN